ncbi:retropepsin-like aspartic protease [Flavobacterium silvaticum]|uniref:PDZ domain-containing protein n=1 Tax=Flavobacterium silvaticum TaxID=1852020 RepID=A0A972FJB0_9FLAO|nr:PDZ domain-containing protein [Flavobacterium silvaticum]NMH27001.1 PDZ domain-containing protein [Flavobacterium silvaticum]
MKTFRFLWLILFPAILLAQDGFQLKQGKHKCSLPFKLINNLIFVEGDLNGVRLTFLLDTGVDDTILFNLDKDAEVELANAETVNLRGLGNQEPVTGLRSRGNLFKVGALSDANHELYVILERDFNFSSHVGIPVHGILGKKFFENYFVQIDYKGKRIFVYDREWGIRKDKFRSFQKLSLTLDKNKPYVMADIRMPDKSSFPAKLLIDTGNSDAIWLFRDRNQVITVPEPNIRDYLGYGFSGEIYGLRARIASVNLANFTFEKTLSAFPDTESLQHLIAVNNRLGSVGGEILRRFNVVFDYKGNAMYLYANNELAKEFEYNMSGLTVQHDGFQWVQQQVVKRPDEAEAAYSASISLTFELKPSFRIVNVREGSPGDIAGLKNGDLLVSVNGREVQRYGLQELVSLFKSEEGRVIKIKIDRDGKIITTKFTLKKLL